MNNSSYKIFLFIALSFVSCSEDPDVVAPTIAGSGTPISLSAEVAQTRGVELTSDDFTTFCLYAYYSDGTAYFNETVTRDTSDGSCSFSATDPYVWPEADASLTTPLSFYGYYPYAYGYYPYDSLAPAKDDDENIYIEYTSTANYANQQDFVVASKSSDAVSSVNLEFDHALSKLNFTLTLDKDEVNIRNVKLYYSYKQLVTTANYYFKSGAWSNLGESKYSSEYQFAEYDNDSSNTKHTFEHSLFMIPQAVSEDGYISVRVEYDIYNGDNFNHTVETGNLALYSIESLGTVLVDEWEVGTEYTYNLTIDTDNEISFNLSVDNRTDTLAQGNIDLQYISYYSDVTSRISTLWADGVDDLVIAGEYSSGKLGYGSVSCPFILGFGDEYVVSYREAVDGETATHVQNYDTETEEYTYSYAGDNDTPTHVIDSGSYKYGNNDGKLFSVDFRLMTNLPTFTVMHGGEPDNSSEDEETYIDGDDPSFPQFIFQYAERLEEVILPEDVIAIGDYAFQGCVNLDKINMFGAKHIEACAFQACTNLTEVITNGSTLTRIHNNGFDGCSSLTTIDLGNIREIDKYGFVNCSSLGVTDLSNVTIVGIHAFDGCTNLDIPSGTDIPNLTTISDYAFAKCEKLGTNTDIVINEAVTIGDYAFNGCSALHLGDTSTEYDLSAVESIGKYAFQDCANITNLDISNITSIGASAFYGCTNLVFANGFTFSNLTDIGASAFQNCSVLCSAEPITITASQITTLGSMAFWRCSDFDFAGTDTQKFTELTSIEQGIFGNCEALNNPLEFINATSIGESSFTGCTLLPSVTITPEKITSIGDYAFNNCAAMKEDMIFSDNLTSIGSSAFASSAITSISGLDGVISVGEKAFEYCTSLKTLSLMSLTSLSWQWGVFRGCTSLESVALGQITTTLGSGETFKNCTSLTSVTGLESVTDVPSSCFMNCSSLTTVDVSSAESVGDYAFEDCTSLKELNLPKVTTVGSYAFSGCTKLETFSAPILDKELGDILPYSSYSNLISVELGFTGSFGGYGSGTIENPDEDGEKKGIYSNYTNITTLKYPNATEVDGGTFFTACSNYKEIYLPKVSTVGGSAMKGLSGCTLTIGTEASSDLVFGAWVFGTTGEIDLIIPAPGSDSNYTIDGNILTITTDEASYIFNSINSISDII